jgi:hypothetical protein
MGQGVEALTGETGVGLSPVVGVPGVLERPPSVPESIFESAQTIVDYISTEGKTTEPRFPWGQGCIALPDGRLALSTLTSNGIEEELLVWLPDAKNPQLTHAITYNLTRRRIALYRFQEQPWKIHFEYVHSNTGELFEYYKFRKDHLPGITEVFDLIAQSCKHTSASSVA